MAAETFGKTAKGLTEYISTPNRIRWLKTASGSAGPLASISLYIKTTSGSIKVKCAIYDASFNLLANGGTEERDIGVTDQFEVFEFVGTKPEVAGSTVYYLAMWSNGSPKFYHDSVAGSYYYQNQAYNGWPAGPLSPSNGGTKDISIFATYVENQAPTAPSALQCEGETNPTEVTDLTPEFSAVYEDPDTGDLANAVEIEVGTTPGANDLWDSGWIDISGESLAEGGRCAVQSYDGSALSLDGVKYYWRIRFRDDDNEEGAWSDNAEFTMGAPPAPAVGVAGGLLSQVW